MEVTFFLVRRALGPRGIRVLLCALALLAGITGMGPARAFADENQEARTTFEQGVAASRASHWEEARVQFERSLALVPKPSTMFNLALAYTKLGLGSEALAQLDAFEQAATPDEHGAMLERAKVLRPQAQALVDSARAKAQSGGNVLSRSDDGLSFAAQQDVVEARENYAKGRDKQALEGFERAYRRSKSPELLYNIGVVADRLRDDRRAISAYDAFVKALPDAREAAVAQVRSESLRIALEHENGEPRATGAPITSARAVHAPANLRPARALLVTGSLLTAGSVVALAALAHKLVGYNACLDSVRRNDPTHQCDNPEPVRNDKPAVQGGVAASAIVAATGLVLTTVGAVQLYRRKHAASAGFAVLPSFTAGLERAASVLVIGRF